MCNDHAWLTSECSLRYDCDQCYLSKGFCSHLSHFSVSYAPHTSELYNVGLNSVLKSLLQVPIIANFWKSRKLFDAKYSIYIFRSVFRLNLRSYHQPRRYVLGRNSLVHFNRVIINKKRNISQALICGIVSHIHGFCLFEINGEFPVFAVLLKDI